jgi:hypothetical protein
MGNFISRLENLRMYQNKFKPTLKLNYVDLIEKIGLESLEN